ncbi:MAG TPA: SagB family peptide dehydrogenase [Rectinemataceae bacterium]|nr:SagB family peptide dehydrogenase [Rectinemataceae bacterium]
MACYFFANIRVDDPSEYQKYLEGVEGLAARFGGRYLAVDTAPEVLEGEWPYSRAVIIQFDNEDALRRWYASSEYRSIVGHRLAAGRSDSLLIHGEERDMDDRIASGREFLKSNWNRLEEAEPDQAKGIPPPPQEDGAPEGLQPIALPPIGEISLAATTLRDLIENRKSRRKYLEEALSLVELSYLLWAAQGIRERKSKYSFRTVPSGGARHPLDLYVYASHVSGLEEGLYRYLPLEHALCPVRLGSNSAGLDDALLGQLWNAAACFLWVAVPYRSEWRYSVVAHKLVALDAGHSCQNLYLACESLGLGTCAVGAYDQVKTDAYLGLDGKDRFTIYAAPIGRV